MTLKISSRSLACSFLQVTPVSRRLTQEDYVKFKASLGYPLPNNKEPTSKRTKDKVKHKGGKIKKGKDGCPAPQVCNNLASRLALPRRLPFYTAPRDSPASTLQWVVVAFHLLLID